MRCKTLHSSAIALVLSCSCSIFFSWKISTKPFEFKNDVVVPTLCNGNSTIKCNVQGFNYSQYFQPSMRIAPIEDSYITLWLHHVHRWFKPVGDSDSKQLIKEFLHDAKDSGFTAVMGDLPFEWTEHERGKIQLDSYGKDWMDHACTLGLRLHLVISMRHVPPWIYEMERDDFFEYENSLEMGLRKTVQPAAANPLVWSMLLNFTKSVANDLVHKYGKCIETISPTMNNELETRFVQTFNAMRDYSPSSVELYKQWQLRKGLVASLKNATDPPVFSIYPICEPVLDEKAWWWLGFREEFLASRYIELCQAIHDSNAKCLLHFGEMFASTDHLNSNLFFKLASSPFVHHLVMDSNMALVGAPSSPSVVGVLVSAAQGYGKKIHYEAATERILECNDDGHPSSTIVDNWDGGGPLLMEKGFLAALDAGVHSIGITNLCVPKFAGKLFSKLSKDSAATNTVHTALPFGPTAVIFVPYRAFYAWKFVISDISCGVNASPCWHESFSGMEVFGYATLRNNMEMCPIDIAQGSLVQLWDMLRVRHSQIAIVGDPAMLTASLLTASTSHYIITFPCLTDNGDWKFFEGKQVQKEFLARTKTFTFKKYRINELPFQNCTV